MKAINRITKKAFFEEGNELYTKTNKISKMCAFASADKYDWKKVINGPIIKTSILTLNFSKMCFFGSK